jgi:crotonobetaine/carnitine-CoA ligase
VQENFGMSEGTLMFVRIDDSADVRLETVGRPVSPDDEVRLVDDEDAEVPVGGVGEVVVRPRGPHGMYQGYWGKPEATAEAWRDLWHHTGDYARADADGFLTFVDRKTDSMRRRGENVSSLEVERAIVKHPAVREVAVHAIPSPLGEDDIKACLVLDASVTPDELFGFFKAQLPYFCMPRYVEIVDELPRNATMRVMKHVLRARGVTDATWDFEAMGLTVARAERR